MVSPSTLRRSRLVAITFSCGQAVRSWVITSAAGPDEMLAVVDDHQAATQQLTEEGPEVVATLEFDTRRSGDGFDNKPTIADDAEVREHGALSHVRFLMLNKLRCEAGLATAAGAKEGKQAGVWKESPELGELLSPADKGRQPGWHSRSGGHVRIMCPRSESGPPRTRVSAGFMRSGIRCARRPFSRQIRVLGSDAAPPRNPLMRRSSATRKRCPRYRASLWIRRLEVRILPPQHTSQFHPEMARV